VQKFAVIHFIVGMRFEPIEAYILTANVNLLYFLSYSQIPFGL
jgi:hypothetical protein